MNAQIPLLLCLALTAYISVSPVSADDVYFNDFNGPVGSKYPEWTSSAITYASTATPPGKGTLPPPMVSSTESPNHAQKFLGEFGGPPIGMAGDPGYNHTRVEQTVTLSLHDLPQHTKLKVSFDLYLLKSWDGTSPAYGPDRWSLVIAGGRTLFASTFSNNPKVQTEGCYQDYPHPKSAPQSGAASTKRLGYSDYFTDSSYHFDFTFEHSDSKVMLNFCSSLFEGKGTADESWGLDNVKVSTSAPIPGE